MMIAGPALVDWASLGDVSKEELGASKIHTRNGAIDDEAKSEVEAFEMARQFLSYLPSSVDELPPLVESDDDPERADEALIDIVPKDPRQVYKMHDVLDSVCDEGSFFEIGRKWGRSIITGLARFNGIPVAIFAENPRVYGGAWTADAARKLIRLVDLAGTFHLPLIHLEDCPGFLIGKQSEEEATIRHGSAALAALGQTNVPFCCVVVRKAFGVAGGANHKPGSHHFRAAWPSGDWGSLPIEGGIEVAYKAELAEVDDYDEHLCQDQGPAEPIALAVPLGGVFRDRRDHRSAQDACVPMQLGEARPCRLAHRGAKLLVQAVMRLLLAFAVVLTTQVAIATTCTSGDMVRRVTVVYDDPGQPVPCSVLYEKPGQGASQTLWSAQNEIGYCEDKAQGFIIRLDALGWECAVNEDAETAPSPPPVDDEPAIDPSSSAEGETKPSGRVQKTFLPAKSE